MDGLHEPGRAYLGDNLRQALVGGDKTMTTRQSEVGAAIGRVVEAHGQGQGSYEEALMEHPVIQRCLTEIKKDTALWDSYKEAAREAQGLDTDFPEQGDGPIRRFHVANEKIRSRAVQVEPTLLENWRLMISFLLQAEKSAFEEK